MAGLEFMQSLGPQPPNSCSCWLGWNGSPQWCAIVNHCRLVLQVPGQDLRQFKPISVGQAVEMLQSRCLPLGLDTEKRGGRQLEPAVAVLYGDPRALPSDIAKRQTETFSHLPEPAARTGRGVPHRRNLAGVLLRSSLSLFLFRIRNKPPRKPLRERGIRNLRLTSCPPAEDGT